MRKTSDVKRRELQSCFCYHFVYGKLEVFYFNWSNGRLFPF